ncbi:MAG: hypothetical protein ACBZ72_11265 [Candidatus Bathyarchaeia archaeon]
MKKSNKKPKLLLSIIMMLALATTLVALPSTNAHSPPWDVPTWCYVAVTNNPIGVGQLMDIVFWLNAYPPTANGAYGDRWTFNVEVTKPDGTMETLGPIISDPVGSGFTHFTPDQIGEYTVVAKFEAKTITGEPFPPDWSPMSSGATSINDTYLASSSDPVYFMAQKDQIEAWQEPPLPTQYWEVPVNSANRNWASLVGNWLGGAAQTDGPTSLYAYGVGPESAHILWTREEWAGGIMDERFGDTGYQTEHYDGISFDPIILNGKIYYNSVAAPHMGWWCVDLYTGETVYYHNTTGPVRGITFSGFDYSGGISGEALAFGQIYDYESPNQHGGFPYLWSTGAMNGYSGITGGSTWMLFDAVMGNYICDLINVPSWAVGGGFFGPPPGVNVYGKDGSLLWYNIVDVNGANYLQCWNTSRALWDRPFSSNTYWMWRTYLNYTFDGNNGYSLNVSVPQMPGSILAVREDQFVIGGTSGKNNGAYVEEGNLWALSLEPGQEGTLLWDITYTPPETVVPDTVAGGIFGGGLMSGPTVDPEDGVFIFNEPMTRQWWGFNLETGDPIWGPTEPENSWNYYGMSATIYDGKLISYGGGMAGTDLVAYDITTGDKLWTYVPAQEGFESPYGTYPLMLAAVCDGKLYMYSTEHSPSQPLWRGSYMRCINATNGDEIWKLLLWDGTYNGGAISDGYLLGLNHYDNKIYCIGKGPSQTTVSAPQTVLPLGTSVFLTGTVTDQSPGAPGTPAICDEDMQDWMEYLYEQQIFPKDAKGVTVHLTAVDPNGNTQEIGNAFSDIGGSFGIAWAPPVEGTYQVTATFEGSKSYGSSYATTHFAVGSAAVSPVVTPLPSASAPAPTLAPTKTASSLAPESPSPSIAPQPTSGMPTTTYIAIGAAVVIIVAAALALRRRK